MVLRILIGLLSICGELTTEAELANGYHFFGHVDCSENEMLLGGHWLVDLKVTDQLLTR
jgi:hypothetical protein